MRKEPDIVRELREAERLGVLHATPPARCTRDATAVVDSVEPSPAGLTTVPSQQTPCSYDNDLSCVQTVYHTLLTATDCAVLVVDAHGRVQDCNTIAEELIGKTKQELINIKVASLYPADEWLAIESVVHQRQRLSYRINTKIQTAHQRCAVVSLSLYTLKNIQGRHLGFLHVIKDMTEKQPAAQPLSSILDYTDDSFYLLDRHGHYMMANNELLSRLASSREDVLGKTFGDFHTPAETIDFMQKLSWVFEHGRPLKDEHGKDGSWFLRTLSPVKDSVTARTTAVLVVSKDITETKKAVRALRESEQKFRMVLENSLDTIYQLNIKSESYDYVSPSSKKVLGYSPEEMASWTIRSLMEMMYPEDRTHWMNHYAVLQEYKKRKDAVHTIEYRFKHKTLGYRWMSDTCSAIFDENHKPTAIVGTVEDITDRRKVWDEILKSEEKYRVLAETSADGVFTTDALGRLTYVNPSFEKLLGRRKSQILATPFRRYLLEDSIYFFQQIFIDARKKNEKIENVELEIVTGDGSIIPLEANIAPLKKHTEFTGVVCTVRDITQRREIEDELKKNERLKTEFMNIAAHELRSPVTPIKGYLDLIIHDNDSSEKIKNWAKISLRNAERLLKLVNDILDVARLDSDTMKFEMEKLDPVELLTELAEDMQPTIAKKNLEFKVEVPASLPHIIGDKNRLSQVLKNLIGNALKFTDTGFIGLKAEKKDKHIQITVADSGIGISQDEVKKIFTKFYQAYTGEDRNNEGTGLGLFISKEIVKKHNGTIWAESQIGQGSQFIIQIPFIYKMVVDFHP
ncbi:MAG: PAS domain S-box protein [Candidatus Thermoplasmatota archaeon]|nr:PAS domain S-box protein [Candidatus Thermoplasmatota archaeon]